MWLIFLEIVDLTIKVSQWVIKCLLKQNDTLAKENINIVHPFREDEMNLKSQNLTGSCG